PPPPPGRTLSAQPHSWPCGDPRSSLSMSSASSVILLGCVAFPDTSGHGGPCSCDLPPLAHPLLMELGQQEEPPLAGEEVGDPLGNPVEVEAQFEQSFSERPRVRHADGRTLLGQTIDVESGGGEGSNRQTTQPFGHRWLQLEL